MKKGTLPHSFIGFPGEKLSPAKKICGPKNPAFRTPVLRAKNRPEISRAKTARKNSSPQNF